MFILAFLFMYRNIKLNSTTKMPEIFILKFLCFSTLHMHTPMCISVYVYIYVSSAYKILESHLLLIGGKFESFEIGDLLELFK